MRTSYEDDMMVVQLVSGLYNPEHKAKILSELATYTMVGDKLELLVTLEQSEYPLNSFRGKR